MKRKKGFYFFFPLLRFQCALIIVHESWFFSWFNYSYINGFGFMDSMEMITFLSWICETFSAGHWNVKNDFEGFFFFFFWWGDSAAYCWSWAFLSYTRVISCNFARWAKSLHAHRLLLDYPTHGRPVNGLHEQSSPKLRSSDRDRRFCSWYLYQNTHELLLSDRSWTMTFYRMCFSKQQLDHRQKEKEGGEKEKQCESEPVLLIKKKKGNRRKMQYCC